MHVRLIEIKYSIRNEGPDFIQALIQISFILINELLVAVAMHP
jgi:hypothetical protein